MRQLLVNHTRCAALGSMSPRRYTSAACGVAGSRDGGSSNTKGPKVAPIVSSWSVRLPRSSGRFVCLIMALWGGGAHLLRTSDRKLMGT